MEDKGDKEDKGARRIQNLILSLAWCYTTDWTAYAVKTVDAVLGKEFCFVRSRKATLVTTWGFQKVRQNWTAFI
ncbi:hypothetical protein PI95_033330 [Hassallia byssoidea VB512170]|uniref:Uncharacterized protein n=1 Tax=Hassallia byssoidea VB512170 TaxID=1304833 RepID=A0A846HMG6_9CYAN|nr:hypothetical protein [Hassalia byssoidea]NEU77240.1 hypothetical protein [Hassalia byssoidea VB512170]